MYTELQVTTNFSFLRGGSHPDEYVNQAAALGYKAIAVTDHNSVAGVVRAHAAAKERGLRFIPGCCLDLLDGPSLLVYPMCLADWSALCNLLSLGNGRTEKGSCHLYKNDVYQHKGTMQLIVLAPEALNSEFDFDSNFEKALLEYKVAFGVRLSLAITRRYGGDDQKQLYRLIHLSSKCGIPLVATNDVHYHTPARRQLQDILTCVREGLTIYNAGYHLHPNAERHLKPAEEMERLFRHCPEAIRRAGEIAETCQFSLDELKYEYPEEITTDGRTPQEELTMLAWQGAKEYFGDPLPSKTEAAIRYELGFIERLNYAPYFLTVYDIVRFARSQGILCQGRGSAANSTVCFSLGITSVNPEKFELLFERFISEARNEPPDIDVDFEHERREEVMQYIYQKYGRDRAAIVATVTTMHGKGAIRDVGKAMGLSQDLIDHLAENLWDYSDDDFEEAKIKGLGLNLSDPHLRKVLELTREYIGFPRQLGQHTGGFVITRGKLTDICPVLNARMEGRTCIEWNKDDIDALGFLKIDVLALGMLTCIRKSFALAKEHYGLDWTLATIPQDDPSVYDMICKADTLGVFQIESRAQQAMLPKLKPKCFYDLVIEVAIVRPGPIQGDMVHPYLRRRDGEEPVEYPSEEVKQILERTKGVPLFQEQAMKIAIVAGGFSPAEADEIRRSMATFKLKGVISKWQEKLVSGMIKKGYKQEYAEQVFKQLEGFSSYGFPESHAASFAQLVYVSCWIKHHYPDLFACAILNSLPMGFYQPAQLARDAQGHGVMVRPVDVNHSFWDHTLEEQCGRYKALRLGFRQIMGIRLKDISLLLNGRRKAYHSIGALRDVGLTDAVLERLADADAFHSLQLDRRQASWEVTTKDHTQALFKGQLAPDADGENVELPVLLPSEHVVQDYCTIGLSLKAHPVSFLRPTLDQLHVFTAKGLAKAVNGQPVKVAGLVLVRQRPQTAKGVWFMTIEDETGFANLVLFPNITKEYRKAIIGAKLFMAEGTVQIEGDVIHVIVNVCYNISKLLGRLVPEASDEPLVTLREASENGPTMNKAKTKQESIFGNSRDFK